MARPVTVTGGREATTGVIPGRWALSVGRPEISMAEGFRWVALSDVARLESGHTPSRRVPEYWGGDVPWIGIRDATENHGRQLLSTRENVTEQGIANSSARVLPAGTVCLSRTASVGYVVMMGQPMSTSQDFVNWVCGPDLVPRYLMYVLMAEQESIRRFAHGTTHQTMYYPEAKALHVCLPDKRHQEAVVEVLASLDDKIEANRQITLLSDQLWRSTVASALDSIEQDDDADEPGEFALLSALATFVNGRAFTKNATGTGLMVVRIAELHGGPGPSTVYNDIDVATDYLVVPGDLLFAWSGSLTVQRWFRSESIVNQHIFKVVPEPGIPVWLVHAHLLRLLPGYQRIAEGKATTMGHIQRGDLDIAVAVPEKLALARLDAVCEPLWKRALRAEMESLSLVVLRDALLPSLLTGEVTVREAESLMEDAG